MSLPQRLSALLVDIVPGRPEVFDLLREHYTDDVVFRDPIQTVHGLTDFLAMNERLLGKMKTLEWSILGAWGDDESATLEWTMRGKPKLGPRVEVDGMTRVRARDGKIYDHRDYWDLGELAASGLPGGKRVLRAVLRPFA